MAPDFWSRVTDLMHRALDVPEPDRLAWAEREAAGEVELLVEVQRLLTAHARAGPFLERPVEIRADTVAAVIDALTLGAGGVPGPGTLLGQYRVLRELGRGGMGTVFLGTRADAVFEKQVAIKVAPAALVSPALRERFNRERHLLAALDHPGIARLLDGGATQDGLPYLVMEYVDGTPIDTYCDAHHLGLEARLRLFVEVCRAVQYAHDRLIVHRDIKAGNVLVGQEGRPKLLDFGIAKLLVPEDRGADPGATAEHAWTPESASPEQVRGEVTTIATDVYGLGALLFRLLTGRPVFDLAAHDPVARARIICEAVPMPPSVIVRRVRGGAAARPLRGDLDAIVLKALHKEPARRYRSAEHLAEDLDRHLAQRPVLAAPDHWHYRVRKFIGRHPLASVATTGALLAVAVATAAALWQAHRADQERQRAEARLADVRRLANTLIFDLYDRVGNTPDSTPLRRALVEQGLAYLDRLAADAGADSRLSVELAEAYGRLARVQGVPGQANLGDRQGALASLEKGRALLAPLRAAGSAPVDVEVADLRLLRELASTIDEPDRARTLLAECIERADALGSRFPDRPDVLEARANAYFFAALVAGPKEALRLWGDSNRVFQQLADRAPGDLTHLRSLALTEKYIGAEHHAAKRLDQARTHYERALELDRLIQQAKPEDRQTASDLAFDLGNVASIARESEPPDLARATSLYRESLLLRERVAALDSRDVFARQAVGYCLLQLSNLSRVRGDIREAVEYGRRSVAAYESLPPSTALVRRGYAWLALGRAHTAAGHHEDGCVALRRAREVFTLVQTSPRDRALLEADTPAFVSRALEACRPRP